MHIYIYICISVWIGKLNTFLQLYRLVILMQALLHKDKTLNYFFKNY